MASGSRNPPNSTHEPSLGASQSTPGTGSPLRAGALESGANTTIALAPTRQELEPLLEISERLVAAESAAREEVEFRGYTDLVAEESGAGQVPMSVFWKK